MAWHRRIWNLLRSGRLQNDLEREMAFHLRERAEELRQGGMSETDANRAARLRFGNVTSQIERTRDMDIHGRLESIARNVKYAGRTLARTPAFTVTVILTLALGIGANSAVFSAIDAVLLRPLPYPEADRLVTLQQVRRNLAQPLAPVRLEEWNRLNQTFQAIAGHYEDDVPELSTDIPEKMRRAFVSPRFFEVWGIAPAMGRDFSEGEFRFGGPTAGIISDRLWRRRFASSPNVIGQKLRFGSLGVAIVGVMPASFLFTDRDVDVWIASPVDAPYAQSRDATWFWAVGRLKPGVTVAKARANLATVQADLGRQFPKTDAEMTPQIELLKETTIGGIRRSLWILFGSVSLLLLLTCANIAALLLSRAAGRQRELAVRFSLGASRLSVAAQLMTEVLILALSGAALGLLLAKAAASVFRTLAKDLPRIDEITLDWRIVAYSFAVAVLTTLLCGAIPAIRGTRRDIAGSLAHGGRSHVSGRNRIQLALVAGQVALAVTLLAGAGLMLRSFQQLARVSPGFDPEHVLTFHISSTWNETSDQKGSKQRAERILDALRALPGVQEAALAVTLPGVLSEYLLEFKTKEGRAETEPKIIAEARAVSPGYFATLRIPVVAGELCRDEANNLTAMVNRTFANRYLNGTAAIGRHLEQTSTSWVPPAEVRGIVGDAREIGLDRDPPPTIYWCLNANQPGSYFLLRTADDPSLMSETVRRTIHELEPRRSVYDLTPLTSHISDAYAENRLRTILLTFFAVTAVSLACVGLYGTLSYLVTIRRRELALRLALGAVRGRVIGQLLGQGVLVSGLGCLVGVGLAAVFARLLSGMLFGVGASDPVTWAGVVVIILLVSALASFLPAVRAARLDPMQALREE